MRLTVGLVLAAFVGLVIGSHSGTAVPAAAPVTRLADKPEAVKWEYGSLVLKHKPHWTCATEHVQADSNEELAKKIQAEIPANASASMVSIAILNRLGSQGWEMATHISMGTYDSYHFKRRVLPKD